MEEWPIYPGEKKYIYIAKKKIIIQDTVTRSKTSTQYVWD